MDPVGSGPVGLHGIQRCGPYLAANIADALRCIQFLICIPGQPVEFIGLLGKAGQIQISVVAAHHGAILVILTGGEAQLQICGNEVESDGAGAIIFEAPQPTGIVQGIHQVLSLIHI